MIFNELMDWKDKKELQLGMIYRYACNQSGIIEKEPAATKSISVIITHSRRTQGSRSIGLVNVPMSSSLTGRLLNAQAVEDEMNPVLAVRHEI